MRDLGESLMRTDLPKEGLYASADDVLTLIMLSNMECCERAVKLYNGLSKQAKEYVDRNMSYFSCLNI